MRTWMDTLMKRWTPRIRNIVEICSSRYLTIEEIAVKTRRTSKYLKNKIVSQLLKDGLLERLYPTTPNHPNQAYKKKQQ